LTLHFIPPSAFSGSDPVPGYDFEFHAFEIWSVVEALDEWGRSWAWDPHLLAGYPTGTVFDTDSKGWEILVFSLGTIGIPTAVAFNLFVLLAHLLLPAVVFASARLFGLGRWASLLSVFLASMLWHFDSFAHTVWRVGMMSYAMAVYGQLLPLALFHRYLESRRWPLLLLLAGALGLLHLIHPFAFTCLVVPMSCLYVRSFRSLSLGAHAGIAAACLFTVAVNGWWLAVALRFWGHIVPVTPFCQGDISYILTDLVGIEQDPFVTGWCGVRTTLRTLVLAAAAACLVRWRGRGDPRFLPLAAGTGALVAIAYLGSHVWVLAQTQPYRHILPAMMLAVIPAASLAQELVRSRPVAGLSRGSLAVVVVVSAFVVPVIGRDVARYFGQGAESRECPPGDALPAVDLPPNPAAPGPRPTCHYVPLPRDHDILARRLARLNRAEGRILVEDWVLAEHLARRTGAYILGGFPFRNMTHAAANLFVRMSRQEIGASGIPQYLEDYAVKWVLLSRPHPVLEALLVPVGSVPFCTDGNVGRHRLFRTSSDASFFAANGGEVDAYLNRIQVRSTDPYSDVVLRFHHLDSFVCKPDCRVEREPLPGDPVGFIRVTAPHPVDFTIVNEY
jgi:hypothetical protein